MARSTGSMPHAVESATLADVLERVLDKGVVIVGDVKVKLVDIELLTIQIRLMIASVDKARELGLDWWARNPAFSSRADEGFRAGAEQAGRRAEPIEAAAP